MTIKTPVPTGIIGLLKANLDLAEDGNLSVKEHFNLNTKTSFDQKNYGIRVILWYVFLYMLGRNCKTCT